MIYETHIHLNHERYDDDLLEVLKNAKENKVDQFLDIGCDRRSIPSSLKLSSKFSEIKSAIGWHPVDIKDISEKDLIMIEEHLKSNDQIVAYGEIGLDYHWYPEEKELQIYWLHKQIKLAQKYDLPIIIHCRNAYRDCYEILSEYVPLKGIIHGFAEDYSWAKKFIDLGFCIGIGGPVTFKNGHKQKDVIKNIDLKNLVIETDGPYLTPVPHRGERNEPKYLKYILEQINDLRDESIEEIKYIVYNNSIKLFQVKDNDHE